MGPEEIGKKEAQRELIHDLQTFLFIFEQGGYSKEAMADVLAKLEEPLRVDGRLIGGDVQHHVQALLQDCRSYVEGVGEPRQVVSDLDQLRQDLEG